MLTITLTIDGVIAPANRDEALMLVQALLSTTTLPPSAVLLDWSVEDGETGEEIGAS